MTETPLHGKKTNPLSAHAGLHGEGRGKWMKECMVVELNGPTSLFWKRTNQMDRVMFFVTIVAWVILVWKTLQFIGCLVGIYMQKHTLQGKLETLKLALHGQSMVWPYGQHLAFMVVSAAWLAAYYFGR